MKTSLKKYKTPKVEKIILDKNISIQMQSPPGDPSPIIKKNRESGDFNPFK
jgi:hypothetical protein